MIQSGGIRFELPVVPFEVFKERMKELIERALEITRGAARYFYNKGIDILREELRKKYFT